VQVHVCLSVCLLVLFWLSVNVCACVAGSVYAPMC